MTETAQGEREPWLAIRRELNPSRQSFLSAISFLLPLAVWCLVSYTPFIWHPDIKLEIGVTSGATVYTAGDHVGKDYFPSVAAAVREQNEQLLEARTRADAPSGSSRKNRKILRQIAQIAIDNGVLGQDQRQDDAAIFEVWKQLATGRLNLDSPALTPDNLDIVQRNWSTLSRFGERYDKSNFPSEPLLSLIPQGHLANPVYLPAPHEVIITGWRDWRSAPAAGKPSMGDRYRNSLGTVFSGFLLAALLAVPLGLVGGTYDFFGRLVEPFTDFFRYMPAPSFGVLLVAVFGAHQTPKVALVFIGTFPHLLLMIGKTAKLLDRSIIEAAQTLGTKRIGLLTRVVIPGTLPNVFNDLRIALGWAWTWLVIAELIGVKTGLTEIIDTQGDRRNFDRVFPVILLIGLTGFLTDQILSGARRRLFPWLGEKGQPGPVGRAFKATADWFEPTLAAYRKTTPAP